MSSGKIYLKNLKEYRNKKCWSQEKLAREAGLSYQAVIKIERGYVKSPRLETIIKIAQALDVSLDDLIK
jgi:transcriptional regulator with XRE-family HTH domain